jgi:thiosulfate dehydrogenase [quinone] large subunit
MNNKTTYSKWQISILVALRFLIGWHLLYEGIYKLTNPDWSSIAFLGESKWIFSGIADWIVSSASILNVVDFLNTWGLITIGLGLILGLFTKAASIAGTSLLMLYYLFNPPFIGLGAAGPVEGHYLFVNKALIEAVALLLFAVFPVSRMYGLDILMKKFKNKF